MRFLLRLTLLVATLLPISGAIPVLAADPVACTSRTEWLLLDDINTFRGVNRMDGLTVSPTLTAAARHQAESMARYGYFPSDYSVQFEGPNHDQTITWQQNIANAGYPDNTHTKRAAMIGSGSHSVSAIVQTLTGLASYRAVLEDPRYLAIGIGFAADPANPDEAYWTVTLGSLIDARLATCDDVPATLPIASATASDPESSPSAAIDGDLGTAWTVGGDVAVDDAWITIDLGSVASISRIEWIFTEPGLADQFTIEVATTMGQTTVIASKTNGAVDQWRAVSWTGEARYIRFAFGNPDGDLALPALAEVRVFR